MNKKKLFLVEGCFYKEEKYHLFNLCYVGTRKLKVHTYVYVDTAVKVLEKLTSRMQLWNGGIKWEIKQLYVYWSPLYN